MPFRTPNPNAGNQGPTSNFGTPPAVDRLPAPRPLTPPPQEPYFENPWGPLNDTNLPNAQFPQGDGTYGPNLPLNPVPILDGGAPIQGPAPMPPAPPVNTNNQFGENYNPIEPTYPAPRQPRVGTAGLTPDKRKSLEEYKKWQEDRKNQQGR
jgi:hypothetical protein